MKDRKQQTASMEYFHGIVDEALTRLDRLGIKPPPENSKNYYLKACWLVALFNKRGYREAGKEVAQILPLLKAETEKAN